MEPERPRTKAIGLHIKQVAGRYFNELGGHAYAAFNAFTDLASHPPVNRLVRRDRHSFQSRV